LYCAFYSTRVPIFLSAPQFSVRPQINASLYLSLSVCPQVVRSSQLGQQHSGHILCAWPLHSTRRLAVRVLSTANTCAIAVAVPAGMPDCKETSMLYPNPFDYSVGLSLVGQFPLSAAAAPPPPPDARGSCIWNPSLIPPATSSPSTSTMGAFHQPIPHR
jgi:hypothetical protein